jgi:hypothetical protein
MKQWVSQQMSKGSKVVPIRFPTDLLAEVMAAIASRNEWTYEEPNSLGEWIRDACRERLNKLKRGRRKKGPQTFTDQDAEMLDIERIKRTGQ